MSISEQVKELREFEIGWLHDVPMAKGIMRQAADTIEALSEKLANMERSEDCGGWILCENGLPEDGQEVLASDGKYVYLVEYDADLDCPFGDVDNIQKWKYPPKP